MCQSVKYSVRPKLEIQPSSIVSYNQVGDKSIIV